MRLQPVRIHITFLCTMLPGNNDISKMKILVEIRVPHKSCSSGASRWFFLFGDVFICKMGIDELKIERKEANVRYFWWTTLELKVQYFLGCNTASRRSVNAEFRPMICVSRRARSWSLLASSHVLCLALQMGKQLIFRYSSRMWFLTLARLESNSIVPRSARLSFWSVWAILSI